ncbi:hypothetical protein NXS19_002044 [Fusarium pseudograminearum]|nr:hypothetical protein NXS19_002044 [Fusarium pseudograminearum]
MTGDDIRDEGIYSTEAETQNVPVLLEASPVHGHIVYIPEKAKEEEHRAFFLCFSCWGHTPGLLGRVKMALVHLHRYKEETCCLSCWTYSFYRGYVSSVEHKTPIIIAA